MSSEQRRRQESALERRKHDIERWTNPSLKDRQDFTEDQIAYKLAAAQVDVLHLQIKLGHARPEEAVRS